MSAVLLVVVFMTGGGSYDRGWGDTLAELMALPVLGLGVMAWLRCPRTSTWWATSIAIAAVVLLLVMYQLPMPDALLAQGTGRVALAADLQAVGVQPGARWSLTPLASERGAWSVLPALALFLAVATATVRQQRTVVLLIIALTMASMVLGLLQLGQPQDSPLNLFPEWPTTYGGFFVAFNHQATALALGALLSVGVGMEADDEWPSIAGRLPRAFWFVLAAAMLASIPLTGSRAVGVLAPLAIALLVLVRLRPWGAGRTTARALSAALVAGCGLLAVIGWKWLEVDRSEELRNGVAAATLRAGEQLSPIGGGLGAFVPWFEQTLPHELVASYFFNHAHNEYAQWWLEGGWPAMAVLALVLLALVLAAAPIVRRSLRKGPSSERDLATIAALLGIGLLLGHSVVDYPMRTQALMAVAAVLAALVVSRGCSRPPRTR